MHTGSTLSAQSQGASEIFGPFGREEPREVRLDGNFERKVKALHIATEAMQFALIATSVDRQTMPGGSCEECRERWAVHHALLDSLFTTVAINVRDVLEATNQMIAAD